ncbi:unnamed protein product [Oikopleura dioica]|uniref:MAM domain-containing protein n=1 Tax=Oikopleura dioica TaxID=34765 RepID=E4X1R7_OIKDI|nr:unnamed protein product [Oikopleura dioica]
MKLGRLFLAVLQLANGQSEIESTENEVFINEDGEPIGIRCTFEDGWCPGFYNQRVKDPGSHYTDWTVGRGQGDSPVTGPDVDHTLGTESGHYLHLKAQGVRFLAKGELISMNFKLDYSTYCVGMWYHMMGKHAFSLNIFTSIPRDTRKSAQQVLKASGAKSRNKTNWLYIQNEITVPHFADRFANFTIHGVRGLSYSSDIAIDDFFFLPGPCPVLTTTKTPPQTTMPSFVPTTKPTLSPTTTTTEDPTEKREFMPFLTGKVLNCNVNGSMESYLATLSVCCGGKVLRRSSGSKCCNGVQYFNRKQDCCDNQVINTAEKTCCGGVITEKVAGEICCGGEKRPESKNEKCCGDKVFFDPTANGCCGGETFDRATHYCCGQTLVDLTDEETVCCGSGHKGQVLDTRKKGCCNENSYELYAYSCCAETFVYHKREERCDQETGVIRKTNINRQPNIIFGDKHWLF